MDLPEQGLGFEQGFQNPAGDIRQPANQPLLTATANQPLLTAMAMAMVMAMAMATAMAMAMVLAMAMVMATAVTAMVMAMATAMATAMAMVMAMATAMAMATVQLLVPPSRLRPRYRLRTTNGVSGYDDTVNIIPWKPALAVLLLIGSTKSIDTNENQSLLSQIFCVIDVKTRRSPLESQMPAFDTR